LTYGLTVAYALTLRFVEKRRWLVDVQIAGDALIVSAFIYFTGGVASFFTSLYGLPIIGASLIQYRRGGFLAAALSTTIYVGLVLLQYLTAAGLLHDPWLIAESVSLPSRSVAQYTVALNVSGFFVVALLSGSLADRLQSAGARLERASNELADLHALNQDVINSLPSGLVTTDSAQRVLTFNHAAETITGVPLSAAVGRPVADVLQLPPTITDLFKAGLRGAGVRRLDVRYRTGDGRGEIPIGLSATNLEMPSGRPGILITFQDLTVIRKLERDVQIQQRLAAVGEMAAGIAHEIRNPLASMSGSIQILRQELPLTSEQEQLMDIVLRESERLNTTIRSFLAYARPQRFAIARFDVRRALNDTALLLRNSAEVGEGHGIEVDVPRSELWYEADEGQIRQIVWNLATNGLRAMPQGGRLLLAASTSSDGVVIEVEDDGMGIAADELDRLFQPFHGSFAKGSGLGLAIVHRIVTDYNGEIHVSSQPGLGTRVSVRLPARAEVTA
jgi:two-component system sensor histidine kinase PilS (NtrC family)